MADCRRGLIDRVLVKSISRFARNTKECLETIRELKSLGVGVYFEKENIDTATMSGEMMTALFASFAQAESESISGNMRWGIQKRMQAGTYIPANLPYGYTLQDHSIRIVEEQAVIVQRIFKEYLSGKSTERIASDLREEGIPCKSGEVAWDSTAIRYIISNEKYIGDSVWQKYFSTDTLPYKCRLNRGQKVSYYAYGTHEGIVPKEDFEKANALMKSRAQKITLTKNSPYAFRKKIVCGDCQSLFRRKVVRGITYWVCIGHDKKRHGLKCGITPIAEDEITNEKYCGDVLLQKTYTSDCISRKVIRNTGQLPMYLVQNHHEGIVERKTFDAVQAEMARRSAGKSPSKKNAPTGMTSYASKYALSERLVCGECGTLYRRCTWSKQGRKRVVWRCVSRLDYGTKYCHNSPTLDEEPLQKAILAAINSVMSEKSTLIRKITSAMEMELAPVPGESMSLADIERQLGELNDQTRELVAESARAEDATACTAQLRAVMNEAAVLKEKRALIEEQRQSNAQAVRRIEDAAAAMAQASTHISEWDEALIRQLVDTVKVNSAEKITVFLRGGVQVEQDMI